MRTRANRYKPSSGFTLIELLVVIAVMAILAALLIPLGRAAKIRAAKSTARVELAHLSLAIDDYKADKNYYPVDNPANPAINCLFYELSGTTNNTGTARFQTLDGSEQITPEGALAAFGVTGFMNCDPAGGGSPPAKKYLRGLPPSRSAIIAANSTTARILVSAVRSSASRPSPPLGAQPDLNPVNYLSSQPTNHPGAYDLWVDFYIGGKSFRVNN